MDQLHQELRMRYGLKKALQNPLLLNITLSIYAEWQEIPRLGERYERYVQLLMRGRGVRRQASKMKPAWEDIDQAQNWLSEIAWGLHQNGSLSVAEVIDLLAEEASPIDIRRFLQQITDWSGLLNIHVLAGNPNDETQCTVTFAPHKTFQDYFVARYWDTYGSETEVNQLIQSKINQLDWQSPIFFYLSILDNKGESFVLDRAWPLLQDIFALNPIWGTRCLHEGLEMQYAELEKPQRSIIYSDLKRRTGLFPDNEHPHSLLSKLFGTGRAKDVQIQMPEALLALGILQVREFGEEIPGLLLGAQSEVFVKNKGNVVCIHLGAEVLWPALQPFIEDDAYGLRLWKKDVPEYMASVIKVFHLRTWVLGVVASWQTPEALPIFQWILRTRGGYDLADAMRGIAQLDTPEAAEVLANALKDPVLRKYGMSAALETFRPGLIETMLLGIENDEFETSSEQLLFVKYLAKQPEVDAKPAVQRLLQLLQNSRDIKETFQISTSNQEYILPLLRLIAPCLRDANQAVVSRANTAIMYVLWHDNYLDATLVGARAVLEELYLYGDNTTRGLAIKMWGTSTLSEEGFRQLYKTLDINQNDPYDVFPVIEKLPPLELAHQQKLIDKLVPLLESPQFEHKAANILADLGAKEAIPTLVNLLQTNQNPQGAEKLVLLGAPEAFPYILKWYEKQFSKEIALLALPHMPASLDLKAQQKIISMVQDCLGENGKSSEAFQLKTTALFVAPQLNYPEIVPNVLACLSHVSNMEQEPVLLGGAIGGLGWRQDVSLALDQAYASRQPNVCGAVIYAWGNFTNAEAGIPLIAHFEDSPQYFDFYEDARGVIVDSLQLKARMSMSLARLAVNITQHHYPGRDIRDGWLAITREFGEGQTNQQKIYFELLKKAVREPNPARILYEESLQSSKLSYVDQTLLVGAYEWSQVLWLLEERNLNRNLVIWKMLDELFSDVKSEKGIREKQEQLALRLNWYYGTLPFQYLLDYSRVDQEIYSYLLNCFSFELRKWFSVLEWGENYKQFYSRFGD